MRRLLLFLLLCLPICAQKDVYGGLTALPGTNTGNWHRQQLNGRWWLVTPLGNAYHLIAPFNTGDFGLVASRYGGNYCNHVMAETARMGAWGINGIGITTYTSIWPWTAMGCWPGNTMPEAYRKPVVLSIMTSVNAVLGRTWSAVPNTLDQPPHPFHLTINPVQGAGASGLTSSAKMEPDFYDSRLYSYFTYLAQNQQEIKAWWTASAALKKYLLGITIDEADHMFSFTTGGDNPATMTNNVWGSNEHLNGGLHALRISPLQYAANNGPSAIYPDPRLQVKAVGLRNYLKTKYTTIAKLNTAWGSSYSACDMEGLGDDFGSCGTQITGEAFATANGSSSSYTHTLAHLTPSWHSVGIFVGGVLVGGDTAYNGYAGIWRVGSGLTNIVVSSNIATAHFAYDLGFVAGNAIVVSGAADSDLNGRKVIINAPSASLTFATSGVADGTYSNAELGISETSYANPTFPVAAAAEATYVNALRVGATHYPANTDFIGGALVQVP